MNDKLPFSKKQLFRSFNGDFDLFPLPICNNSDEEKKQLHVRQSEINTLVDELFSSYEAKSFLENHTPRSLAKLRLTEVIEALRYARKFLNPKNHDTKYIDRILNKFVNEGTGKTTE